MLRSIARVLLFATVIPALVGLHGCGSNPVHIDMYQDAPTISAQKEHPILKNVTGMFSPPINAEYGQLLKSLRYPAELVANADGEPDTIVRVEIFTEPRDWWLDASFNGKTHRNTFPNQHKALYALLEDNDGRYIMDNYYLGEQDITIFEFKIVGRSNHQETIGTKRFSGPVHDFSWIELFERRVPHDSQGYILTVTVAVNYLDKLGDRDYFVHLPLKIGYRTNHQTERELTSSFLNRHYMFNNENTHNNLLKREARYSIYSNEQSLRRFNQELATALYRFKPLSSSCSDLADTTKDLAVSHSKVSLPAVRKRAVKAYTQKYDKHNDLLTISKDAFSNAATQIARWSKSREGLNVQIDTLKTYNKLAQDIAKHLPVAENNCADFRSAMSYFGTVKSRSTPSALSMLGEAMSDRVRSGYTSSYSSGSSYSGNSSSPVDAAWSQFHKDLNTTYNIALKDEQAKREQRQHDYTAKLSQLRAQQQTGQTKPQVPTSRLRPQYSSQANRQTVNSSHSGNNNTRYGSTTVSGQPSAVSKNSSGYSSVTHGATSGTTVVAGANSNSSENNKQNKEKSPCTGKFESLGVAPKGQCGYVYSDYTRNVRLDYDDVETVLQGSSENSAKADLKASLRNAAEKECKASNYSFFVHENTFKHYEFDWQVTSCKDNGTKGVGKGYKCKGTASFSCGHYVGRD